MEITDHSKKNADGGQYDQAVALYGSIARRRQSRFMSKGKLPGLLCLVSSKRFPGQFTDQKEEEAEAEIARTGKTSIYVYDKRVWDVKPKGSFSGVWFRVFCGDASRKPKILEAHETVAPIDERLVLDVPEEYRKEFERDILSALRDIGGVSILATSPYFTDVNAVSEAFGKGRSLLSKSRCTLTATDKLDVYPEYILHPKSDRFAHVDLALTGDSAGVVMGHVSHFEKIKRGGSEEVLPHYVIDFVLEVPPPPNGEILFSRIREILYAMKAKLKIPLRWITYDSFQSRDSVQMLRQQGFASGIVSMDKSTMPYEVLKSAFYDRRISIPSNPELIEELCALEIDPKKGKIDHTSKGSKDISDALAGVIYGLTMRREIWGSFNVHPRQIPVWLQKKESTSTSALREAMDSEV